MGAVVLFIHNCEGKIMSLPETRSIVQNFNYLDKSYLFYGQPKAGKTTIASAFGDDEERVLFFPTEPGHKFQTIYQYTVLDASPSKWLHFLACCSELIQGKGKHKYKLLCIDTIDHLYRWCMDYACEKLKVKHPSDAAFGKGWEAVSKEFIRPLNALGQAGFGIIFISHESMKEKELINMKVTYTDTTLAPAASKVVCGLCDYILYFLIDHKGNRLIRTRGDETLNAGDRSNLLEPLIEMNAEKLISALKRDTRKEK